MNWGLWIVLGVALLGIEMFVIDAQFYLVFVGVSAVLVGLAAVLGIPMSAAVQWLVFAVLCIATMLTFRKKLYQLARGRVGEVQAPVVVGGRVILEHPVMPGAKTRVQYRGSTWDAINVDRDELPAGEAEIYAVKGFTLEIHRAV